MKEKIYLFSDLHGNFHALNAVINDIGVIEFNQSHKIFLGDYIDFGPNPNEVLDFIKCLDKSHYVIGNHDQYLFQNIRNSFEELSFRDQMILHMTWTNNNVSDENKEWILKLPVIKNIIINNIEILMCHGDLENTEKPFSVNSIQNYKSRLFLTGHTHAPYIKEMDSKIIVNPGSVGEPLDKDSRASYCVINIEEDQINIENRRVVYDIDNLEMELIKKDVPWKEEIIRGIREACLK